MQPEPQKSRLSHVPAILIGAAALLGSASTLYVNLRSPAPTPTPTTALAASAPAAAASDAATSGASATPAPPPATVQVVHLRLDRVQVDNDGSFGTTDWTFEVSVGGEPQFTVPMKGLDDSPGENLARPADPDKASVDVKLAPDKNTAISVRGFRKGWTPGSHAEVDGQAWLSQGMEKAMVAVSSNKPKSPAFILYFTATPAP